MPKLKNRFVDDRTIHSALTGLTEFAARYWNREVLEALRDIDTFTVEIRMG